MPRTPLADGTLLRGQHRVTQVLGQGGFGITYLARNELLDLDVAVKEYFPIGFADRVGNGEVRPRETQRESFEWGRTRFIEEARFLARLEHPNIAGVTDLFEEKGTAYMVLRYETGDSLRRWASRLKRPPTQGELDRITGPLLAALEFLHGQDVLHRDIAPDNIMVRPDGSPVLIDFGAARRLVDARSQGMTAIVKSGYSPPESYVTTPGLAGPWTDIYALAATLYHVISGAAPSEATKRALDDDVKPLAELARGIGWRPAYLAAIDRGLALKAKQRPQSVAAWRPGLSPPTRPAGAGLASDRQVAGGGEAPPVGLEPEPTRMILPAAPTDRRGGPGPVPGKAQSATTIDDGNISVIAARLGAAPTPAAMAAAGAERLEPAPAEDTARPIGAERARAAPDQRSREVGVIGTLFSNPFDWLVVTLSLLSLAGVIAIFLAAATANRPLTLDEHRWLRVAGLGLLWPTILSFLVYNLGYLLLGGGKPGDVRDAGRQIAARNLSLLGQVSLLFVVTSPLVLIWLGLAALARRARTAVPIVLGIPLLAGLVATGSAIVLKLPVWSSGVAGMAELDRLFYWTYALFPAIAGGLGLLSTAIYAMRSTLVAVRGSTP